jgi:hypothetical protein
MLLPKWKGEDYFNKGISFFLEILERFESSSIVSVAWLENVHHYQLEVSFPREVRIYMEGILICEIGYTDHAARVATLLAV